jgi:hypothetical protein
VIINIPSAEGLNDIALRLYFSAWSDLIHILSDFELVYEPGHDLLASTGDAWSEERSAYLAACQPELQSICTVIQQSNELALKSKICEISPFLLLLRNDSKFSTVPKDIDFSDFKTLDALELAGAVNTFCKEPLTGKFIQSYNLVRSLRNKIAHLGYADKTFHPVELLRILVFQYAELWKGRAWLSDRVLFASETRTSFFHDFKYTSPHMVVMHEIPFTISVLTNSEFKQLFGRSKKTRRYFCHACIDNASTRYADLDLDACKTAFLEKSASHVSCAMCGETFKVTSVKCHAAGCKGNIIGDNADEYVGKCHSCGEYQGAES